MITTVTCGKCELSNDFNSRDFKDYPISAKKGIYGVPYVIYCGICGVRCEQRSRR